MYIYIYSLYIIAELTNYYTDFFNRQISVYLSKAVYISSLVTHQNMLLTQLIHMHNSQKHVTEAVDIYAPLFKTCY